MRENSYRLVLCKAPFFTATGALGVLPCGAEVLNPELVLDLDLRHVCHLVEKVCYLRVLDWHDYLSVIICCSLSASCTA